MNCNHEILQNEVHFYNHQNLYLLVHLSYSIEYY